MKTLLATVLFLTTPIGVLADDYQAGYSSTNRCYRSEYREEYIPGTENDPGYVKAWKETIEYPCSRSQIESNPNNTTRTRTYEEYDTNDCSEGTVVGLSLIHI